MNVKYQMTMTLGLAFSTALTLLWISLIDPTSLVPASDGFILTVVCVELGAAFTVMWFVDSAVHAAEAAFAVSFSTIVAFSGLTGSGSVPFSDFEWVFVASLLAAGGPLAVWAMGPLTASPPSVPSRRSVSDEERTKLDVVWNHLVTDADTLQQRLDGFRHDLHVVGLYREAARFRTASVKLDKVRIDIQKSGEHLRWPLPEEVVWGRLFDEAHR